MNMTGMQHKHMIHLRMFAAMLQEEVNAPVPGDARYKLLDSLHKYASYLQGTLTRRGGTREVKKRAFGRLQDRLERVAKMIEFKAPSVIVNHEVQRFIELLDEMQTALKGIVPKLSYEQKERIKAGHFVLRDDPRERVYMMNAYYLGYRL